VAVQVRSILKHQSKIYEAHGFAPSNLFACKSRGVESPSRNRW
jgi:hypothetical protein